MRLPRRSPAKGSPEPTGYVGDHADKLSRIPRLEHDEDERPSRQDLDYRGTRVRLITPPVPLPRFLRRKKSG